MGYGTTAVLCPEAHTSSTRAAGSTPDPEASGTNGEHIHGDEIVVQVQDTVFVSDVVDSDITLHNYVPEDPESIVIQDVIEDVVIEDVQCSNNMQESCGSETIIIPEQQVLDNDVMEQVSLVHCTVQEDILVSDITEDTVSIPEQVITRDQIHIPNMRHVEHMVHHDADIIESEIITDDLPSDVVSEEVLLADCSSEAVIDDSGIPVESPEDEDDDRSNCDDYLMISLDDVEKIEEDSSTEITVDADANCNPCKMDDSCPEVIKVYIFKAEPGEDNLGGTVDIVESDSEHDPAIGLLDQGNNGRMQREKGLYDCK
ncbi:zinc finger X-chromosomal protein-like [Rhinatrema bivittatum]|uniref:zinc finger X-chromosomal protein-like n=1 Tax=Rhinatrema bivittatum TaxID=194408 RepID=UPI00112BEC49|nr:zinc finger X-chromosomal protein-like [Rhinatrema bivittatum]